jgi:uncharacterized protein
MSPAVVVEQPCCSAQNEPRRRMSRRWLLVPALVAWGLLYWQLNAISRWFAFSLIGLIPGTRLGEAIWFFLFETPKVLLLLTLVVFAVGLVRSFFSAERARALLAGRRETAGNVLAAGLGIVTPFCSCSAIPLFIGFVESGVPLGVTLSFLISAPMVNEVALGLLVGLVGWRVAALYLVTGLSVAIAAGWVIGRLKMERFVEEWVYEHQAAAACASPEALSFGDRLDYAVAAVRDIVGRVWPYLIVGIGVGAGIHGYVPQGALAALMGKSAWWSVPAAVLLGVPMYSNAAGIVPVVEALLGKGAALGTTLAFMMSVIALSLPEAIILRKVLKPRLIAVFFGTVAGGILLVGYLFNLIL